MNSDSHQIRITQSLSEVSESDWNALLPADAGPFLKYEFLITLEQTGCVGGNTGWQIAHILLENNQSQLIGAMPLYLKQHSYGEFVFDWSWAEAYQQNNMAYYPKALCAIPFTPVRGARFLASPHQNISEIQAILISALKTLVNQNGLSSAHVLFPEEMELAELKKQGFMLRDSVQFHWHNRNYLDFEQFLADLTMKRRKNIRRERAEVAQHNIEYQHLGGGSASAKDWAFFYHCYANTYLEHRSNPYLTEEFFQLWSQRMPDNLHLIIANQAGEPIAASLLVIDKKSSKAYGRYWGAIEYIPCLHFELSYYQAIEYCIEQRIQLFEGGAQGEHKMARGFLPTTIQSAHWIEDESFSEAIKRFLEREHEGMNSYIDELEQHLPLKSTTVQG